MDIGRKQFWDEKCVYCSVVLDRGSWKSHWERDYLHYKVCKCNSCGKSNSFRVTFFGSGHDSTFIPAKSIDSLVKRVCERER